MIYFFYNLLLTAGFLMALPLLPILLLLGARYRNGLGQRLGFYANSAIRSVTGSKPIWIHAASVGEVRSVAYLVQEFKKRWPGRKILLTTFTSTGNQMAQEIGGADCVLFLPLDLLWIVRRGLTRLNPSILIVVETEIWPNLLREAHRKGIPTVLLSGRLSARALQRYARFGAFFRRVLACFTAMGMQSVEDAHRIVELGADMKRVSTVGSLKHLSANGVGIRDRLLRDRRAEQPARQDRHLLVVGSSHRGEEKMLLQAFVSLRQQFPKLQMVLAPRHPQRFAEVEKLLKALGLQFDKKSKNNGQLYFDAEILLLDTIGDLLEFYAMGDIAFVGGSLVDAGGHNLIEPAGFRQPVLFGPYTANFHSVATELKQKGAGIEVRGVEDLIREITSLLSDPQKRTQMGDKALEVATADHEVLRRNVDLLTRYLS